MRGRASTTVTLAPSLAKEYPCSPAIAPAMRNDSQTAGPATAPAAPSSAKMPAPTIDPTPMKVAWATVIRFFSLSVADMVSPSFTSRRLPHRPSTCAAACGGQVTLRPAQGVGPFGPSAALGTLTA